MQWRGKAAANSPQPKTQRKYKFKDRVFKACVTTARSVEAGENVKRLIAVQLRQEPRNAPLAYLLMETTRPRSTRPTPNSTPNATLPCDSISVARFTCGS